MFCSTKSKENKDLFDLTVYDSVHLINESHWNQVLIDSNLYLSIPFLKAIEDGMKGEMDMRYLIFYNSSHEPIAISANQIFQLDSSVFENSIPSGIPKQLTDKILNSSELKMLVCGNVFICGESGFAFNADLEPSIAYNNLSAALKRIRKEENGDDKLSFLLVKEFNGNSLLQDKALNNESFKSFSIDVNMVLNIHHTWEVFDDYLASMNTKFRTKAKSVFKKSADLEIKSLNASEIDENIERINDLFVEVVENASFKLTSLSSEVFRLLKENLENQFTFNAYFKNDIMIGFCAGYKTKSLYDVCYVGLDYNFNQEFAVYQRMLYDCVEVAIIGEIDQVQFGRTAEELKSGLGAVPLNMLLYLRHRNTLSNKLIKPFVDNIKPNEYRLRQPFKEAFLV